MTGFNNTSSSPQPSVQYARVSVLDFLLPGLQDLSPAIHHLLTGYLTNYTGWLCIWGTLIFISRHAYAYFWILVDKFFVFTVHVSCADEAYDMLVTWAETQKFTADASSSIATVDVANPGGWYRPWRRSSTDTDRTARKRLHYAPWNGHFYFWHKHHLFVFRRMHKEGLSPTEELSISCFSRSPRLLRELLEDCRHHYLGLVQNKTSIFGHQDGSWKRPKARSKRRMSTIILDEEIKSQLINDISTFFEPAAPGWYSERGIPYQRGYLLYGPPGSGKSSLSLSIAGEFGLDIYVVNLSSIGDQNLTNLFAELPPRCLVLLEDIDAVTSNRSKGIDANPDQNATGILPKKTTQDGASLSTLLNVIDGVGSPEGRILIMTTNHLERLDEALIRPGRVDMKIEFRLADSKMMTRLFHLVFERADGDRRDSENIAESTTLLELSNAKYGDTVKRAAGQLVSRVPEQKFSPAEIMSLLLANKQSPWQAVDHVETWMNMIEREKVKKAHSWEYCA